MVDRVGDGRRTGWGTGRPADKTVGQRNYHVVYIPWDTNEGAEWNTKTNQWNHARNNKFRIVNYDPAVNNDADLAGASGNPAAVIYIRGHGFSGYPYIMANTKPPGFQDKLALVLPITDACQRLIDSGLPDNFTGVIKFYSCYSGTKLTSKAYSQEVNSWKDEQDKFTRVVDMVQERIDGIDPNDATKAAELANLRVELRQYEERLKKPPPQDKSLARQGAEYLRSKGYKKCCYYGYLGPLGSLYEMDTEDVTPTTVYGHKTVELEGLQNRPKALKGLDSCRPSVARVAV